MIEKRGRKIKIQSGQYRKRPGFDRKTMKDVFLEITEARLGHEIWQKTETTDDLTRAQTSKYAN